MTPEEKLQLDTLQRNLEQLTTAFNSFVDVYSRMVFIDKVVLTKPLVLRNTYILAEGSDGLRFGKASTDKIGLYGATPVVQAAAITAPTGGATVDTQARSAISSIITALHNLGITA